MDDHQPYLSYKKSPGLQAGGFKKDNQTRRPFFRWGDENGQKCLLFRVSSRLPILAVFGS